MVTSGIVNSRHQSRHQSRHDNINADAESPNEHLTGKRVGDGEPGDQLVVRHQLAHACLESAATDVANLETERLDRVADRVFKIEEFAPEIATLRNSAMCADRRSARSSRRSSTEERICSSRPGCGRRRSM
jgi:hypothetical protein